MEDEMIISLFIERSEQAISELSTKYGKLAQVVCKNILGDDCDSQECVNDALFTTWNSIPPSHPKSLKAFFVKIARVKAIDRYRYNTSKKRDCQFDESIEELSDCLGSGNIPLEDIEREELFKAVNIFLGKLDKRDRIMFINRYLLSYSVQEIAGLMKMKESVVSVRLFRTRDKLKKYLKKENLI